MRWTSSPSIRSTARSSRASSSGLDLRKPLTPEEVKAVHAGMDEFGVLVFHDQPIDDDQQLVFSRSLGPLEQATGDIAAPQDRRMSMDLNDISNLDKNNKVLARDDRRRLFGLGNQLWHSDSSFKPVPAKYSLLSARTIPPTGGNTEFADMRAAYDALDEETKREVHDLICRHSQIFSRGILGFTDFTDAEREKWAPVASAWCGAIRRAAGCRSISRATPARSKAGRCPRRAPSCAISPSTRRSASSSTPMSGGRTTW